MTESLLRTAPVERIDRRNAHQVVRNPAIAIGRAVSDRAYRRALALGDAACAVVTVLAAQVFGGGSLSVTVALVAMLVTCAVARALELYDDAALLLRRSTLDELPRLLQLSTCVALVVAIGSDGRRLPAATLLAGCAMLCADFVVRKPRTRRPAGPRRHLHAISR